MLTDYVVLPYYNATANVWTVTWKVCFLVDGSSISNWKMD